MRSPESPTEPSCVERTWIKDQTKTKLRISERRSSPLKKKTENKGGGWRRRQDKTAKWVSGRMWKAKIWGWEQEQSFRENSGTNSWNEFKCLERNPTSAPLWIREPHYLLKVIHIYTWWLMKPGMLGYLITWNSTDSSIWGLSLFYNCPSGHRGYLRIFLMTGNLPTSQRSPFHLLKEVHFTFQ